MPDNRSTPDNALFDLFDNLSDSEIERFLMDSSEADLEVLELVEEPDIKSNDVEKPATESTSIEPAIPKKIFNEPVSAPKPTAPQPDPAPTVEVSAVPAASAETSAENNFDHKVLEIERSMQDFNTQLKMAADISDSFNDTLAKLMKDIRELQQEDVDDFSIAYEQAYQLRGCLLAARRAFNEVPNFFDLVEQAWENDLYTAQMRQKYQSK